MIFGWRVLDVMKQSSQLAMVIALAAPFTTAVCQAAQVPTVKQVQIPLTFEPNRGQAASNARFVARGTGYYVTLDDSGSRVLLRKGGETANVHMRILNATQQGQLTGTQILPGHSSYFRGNEPSKWITGLPNYAQVRASGVYPGIDLVYYGNQSKLEYDFVVSPGADPKRIRLHFDGVSGLKLDAGGNLVMKTLSGDLTQHKPVVYQTIAGKRRPVDGSFQIGANHDVSFVVGGYDRSASLTIDPTLVYSTFLGGTDTDEGHAIASDGAANTYMVGVTFSTPQGDADVLMRKISADGMTFLYTADFGGSGNDYGNGVAVDVNGYAYVGGRTESTDFPAVNAFQSKNYGASNGYVVRMDPAGTSLTFATYVGGSSDDGGYAIAVDLQGSAYLAGYSSSTDFPTSTGAVQRTNRGGYDAFVFKVASDGTALYSTLVGGGSDDEANAVAVDLNGNAYIAGDTYSDSFPQADAPFQHSRHGGREGFVSQISADGSQLNFSTFIGGSGDDIVNGVAVDRTGNTSVVGSTTTDNSFNVPNRSFNTSFNGGVSDIFVAKYFPNGQSLAWTTFLGSHGGDYGNAIAVDANGNVYVTGDTDSSQYPVTRDAIQSSRNGGSDAVLSVLDTNGLNLLYSTFYGGSGSDSAMGIALDQYAQVYLTGSTSSADLSITQGAVQGSPGGGDSDAFLAKISVYGSAIPGSTPSSDPAPISSGANTESSPVSAFGRGMIAPTAAGKFERTVHTGAAAIQPENLRRPGRQGNASPSRPTINR